MYLIQILLPLYDNSGQRFSAEVYDDIRNELTKTFGGVTAFRSSPAEGVWKQQNGEVSHDEIIVFEVMAEHLDRSWWAGCRQELEERFRQKKLIVRATDCEQL
jgi:hypothetical protein